MTDSANEPPPYNPPVRNGNGERTLESLKGKGKSPAAMSEAHSPATLHLPSMVATPLFKESDTFKSRIERERYDALQEISMLNPQIEALTMRRDDLQSIVDSCDSMLGTTSQQEK